MECRVEEIVGMQLVPVCSDQSKLMTVSYSDVRRIAAAKVKDRLYEKMQLQKKTLGNGKTKINSSVRSSLVPRLNQKQSVVIYDTWEYFVKHIDSEGPNMFLYYLSRNPNHEKFYTRLMPANSRMSVCDLPNVIAKRLVSRYGRSLVLHISDVISNLRNNETLKNLIASKTNQLLHAGYTEASLIEASDTFLNYVSVTLASKWTYEVDFAWKTLVGRVRDLALQQSRCDASSSAKLATGTYHGVAAKKARFADVWIKKAKFSDAE